MAKKAKKTKEELEAEKKARDERVKENLKAALIETAVIAGLAVALVVAGLCNKARFLK